MSSVRRLTWLPEAICGEIAQEVGGLLSSWTVRWNVPAPGPVQCQPVAAGATDALDFVDLLGEPSPAWKQSLAQALFSFDAHGSPLVGVVVQRVIASLQLQVREVFGVKPAAAEEHGPLGDQGIRIAVDMLGQRCGFVMTCAQLRASGRLKSPAPEALPKVNLEQALADTPVPLMAELGKADINVEELMQLAPGDVLLLKESLDAPLRVLAPGSSLELSGHLGTIANPPQRALRWLAS
ncbi:FliM/FliN family flagellar motor switch protein [Roseateles sp. P5_E11]